MGDMRRSSSLATTVLVHIGQATNRTLVLPLLIYYPTSRCNSRCVSCDWWRHDGADDLALNEIELVAASLPALGTRVVAFSGGEPLLRPDVFAAAAAFRARGVRLHLLTSGVLLERFAAPVAEHFERAISLDASTEALYQAARGVAALTTVERGVAAVRRAAPHVPVTARATLHRANFRELPALIAHAKGMGVDDLARRRCFVGGVRRRQPISGSLGWMRGDRGICDARRRDARAVPAGLRVGFVAESPEALRRLPRYYAALGGRAPFPPVAQRALISVVIAAHGSVRRCFFQDPIGKVRQIPLASILAANLRAFRRDLDVPTNPVCARCVCSIRAGWRNAPWQ